MGKEVVVGGRSPAGMEIWDGNGKEYILKLNHNQEKTGGKARKAKGKRNKRKGNYKCKKMDYVSSKGKKRKKKKQKNLLFDFN